MISFVGRCVPKFWSIPKSCKERKSMNKHLAEQACNSVWSLSQDTQLNHWKATSFSCSLWNISQGFRQTNHKDTSIRKHTPSLFANVNTTVNVGKDQPGHKTPPVRECHNLASKDSGPILCKGHETYIDIRWTSNTPDMNPTRYTQTIDTGIARDKWHSRLLLGPSLQLSTAVTIVTRAGAEL